VNLGQGYKNDQACAGFVHFIEKIYSNSKLNALSTVNFFGLLADLSTDAVSYSS